MAARFGGDCTKSSLENRFRRIKTDAKLMNNAVAKGVDPINLDIGGPDGVVPIKGGASGQIRSPPSSGFAPHLSPHSVICTALVFLLLISLHSSL
jgi:hypothetical protein